MAITQVPMVRVNSGPLAAIAAGAALNTNIPIATQAAGVRDRVPPREHQLLRGSIKEVMLYVVNNVAAAPSAIISFWGNTSFNTTNLANIKCLGKEVISASEFVRQGTGLTTQVWIGYVGGLNIQYHDLLATGKFHVTVENEYAGTAFAANKSRLEFGFVPEWGG